ncbi:MAG: WYL domain-containing protein [Chitinophagales bacterium]
MSLTGKLKRFDLIITKLERIKYVSMDAMLSYLNQHDHKIVSRTLQRDFEELKIEFNIYIEYNRQQRGYFIEKDTHTDNVIQFIKNMSLQANLLEFTKENKTSDSIILKENHDLKGVEFIPQLLSAIKNTIQVQFIYQRFGSDEPKQHTILPYALKEYLGRWYLVGTFKNHNNPLTFGVDRILELKITETKFKRDKSTDLKTIFSRMIGISGNDEEREEVILSFTAFQANYIKTLPLHFSQEEIFCDENEVHFKYFIVPNYELQQKILSYGTEVNVLKPATLRKQIKDTLKSTLKQYM